MNINRIGIALAILALLAIPAAAQTHVALSFNMGGPVAVSGGYDDNYEDGDVMYLREEGVCDDDIPVILYIRAHSPYSLRQISALRLRGASWDQLSNWCGVRIDPVGFREHYRDRMIVYGHGYRHNDGRRMERYDNHDGYRNRGQGENGNHGWGNNDNHSWGNNGNHGQGNNDNHGWGNNGNHGQGNNGNHGQGNNGNHGRGDNGNQENRGQGRTNDRH
jgi:hypothetical protein